MLGRLYVIFAVAIACQGCRASVMSAPSSTADGGGHAALDGSIATTASTPCDPLASPSVALATVLGVGKDAGGTLYVVDTRGGSTSPRVLVSEGNELKRQHVAGSGQTTANGGATTQYTFTIEAAGSDGSDARSLLLNVEGTPATASAMALGPADSKSPLGGPGETPLTVVDASAVAGLSVIDLPGVTAYVIDVSNGDAIVITEPGDNESDTDYRLFYGAPGAMVERTIVSFEQALSGYPMITFLVGTTQYAMSLGGVSIPDAGPFAQEPGPGTLSTDSGPLSLTVRVPTPGLGGFSFSCFGP